MTAGGYFKIGRESFVARKETVVILAKKEDGQKSRIITAHDNYKSKATAKRLIERFEGGKKTQISTPKKSR